MKRKRDDWGRGEGDDGKEGGRATQEGDREVARGVKDRIHPRLVPVLFALIAPRYSGTLPGRGHPQRPDTYVRMSDGGSGGRASIISIWRASMRRKRETGRAWRLLNGSVDAVKVAV